MSEDRSDASSSASTSSTPAASSPPLSSEAASKTKFKHIEMPSPEQMMQEDIFNNCIMRTIFSGLGGGAMGAAIGIFSASIENSVRCCDMA
jgi:import inner membrane translocase subunit TIM22